MFVRVKVRLVELFLHGTHVAIGAHALLDLHLSVQLSLVRADILLLLGFDLSLDDGVALNLLLVDEILVVPIVLVLLFALVVLVLDLLSDLLTMALLDCLSLAFDVISGGVHTGLGLQLSLTLLLQLLESLVARRATYILLVFLINSVLVLVDFLEVGTLVVIAPPNVTW